MLKSSQVLLFNFIILLGKMIWAINMFDSNMVFRDMETKEVFVFDKNGIWNKEALNHKLINWWAKNTKSSVIDNI